MVPPAAPSPGSSGLARLLEQLEQLAAATGPQSQLQQPQQQQPLQQPQSHPLAHTAPELPPEGASPLWAWCGVVVAGEHRLAVICLLLSYIGVMSLAPAPNLPLCLLQ
jgi:hypothetical protein